MKDKIEQKYNNTVRKVYLQYNLIQYNGFQVTFLIILVSLTNQWNWYDAEGNG